VTHPHLPEQLQEPPPLLLVVVVALLLVLPVLRQLLME
jgi:hypothetical protein